MKLFKMNFTVALTGLFLLIGITLFSQSKPSIAIVSMDTKGVSLDNISMGNLVRLELEKTNVYEVLDKYDVADMIKDNGIDINECFGKTKLVKVGKLLKADKMLTGSVEKYGDKIIFILRLIDVNTSKIEKANVMEYLNQQDEIQTMVLISINNLLGIENDPVIVDLLINYDRIVTSPKTTVKLNGPRMGAALTIGQAAKRMTAPETEGGLNMFPVSSMFGYQFEFQYLSSGDFQALVETFFAVNGLESGAFIPSLTFMNGFRFNNSGWEIGLGPVFRLTKTARGFWDDNDDWHLEHEMQDGDNYTIERAIDTRGDVRLSTGLIVAVGKTFKSGYLNIPVNIYFSPKKEGSIIGLSFGFNIAKKPKIVE